MPKFASAYLRCSDPRQDKSIEQQRAEIQRRADADGYVRMSTPDPSTTPDNLAAA